MRNLKGLLCIVLILMMMMGAACSPKPVEPAPTKAPATEKATTELPKTEPAKETPSAGVIKLAVSEWEPYSGETLPEKGFMTAMAVEALKRVGYETKISVLPWSRAVEETKSGGQDALLGASMTDERKQWFSYPDVTWNSQVVFYTKAGGNTKFESAEKLAPATVGVFNGSYLIESLSKVKGLTLEPIDVLDQNIKKLADGRINYFIDNKDAVQYILKTKLQDYNTKIAAMEPAYLKDPLYIVFSMKNPNYKKITEDYNKGLQMIKDDGTYDRILKDYGLEK